MYHNNSAVLCDPKAINCFGFHDREPRSCDATIIDKRQLSRYLSNIYYAGKKSVLSI